MAIHHVKDCEAVAPYDVIPGMKGWCGLNCGMGYCPASHCKCKVDHGQGKICKGVSAFAKIPGMDGWCQVNCGLGYCPASHCTCAAGTGQQAPKSGTQGNTGTTNKTGGGTGGSQRA